MFAQIVASAITFVSLFGVLKIWEHEDSQKKEDNA